MPWECGECRQKEAGEIKINTVCHHCGKLLCAKHCIAILDDAFDDAIGVISNLAFHCATCKRKYHPKAIAEQSVARK